MIDLTPIFQAVISLLAALITFKLIPWIKSKTTEKQQENLQALIRVLVFAAEQMYGAGKGAEKMEYVCAELRARGYTVDISQIEAEVFTAFHYENWLLPNQPKDADAAPEKPPDGAERAG